jgi:hypothetical protein
LAIQEHQSRFHKRNSRLMESSYSGMGLRDMEREVERRRWDRI